MDLYINSKILLVSSFYAEFCISYKHFAYDFCYYCRFYDYFLASDPNWRSDYWAKSMQIRFTEEI